MNGIRARPEAGAQLRVIARSPLLADPEEPVGGA